MGEMLGTEELRAAHKAQPTEAATQHAEISAEDVEDIKSQIAETLGETFKAALDMSVHFQVSTFRPLIDVCDQDEFAQALPNAFELFGTDFLVTHADTPSIGRKYQVHLLEVNSEPAIELTGPRLTWTLEDLFAAIGKTCVAPFFSAPLDETAWKVGETKDTLKKCLEVEVRGSRGW